MKSPSKTLAFLVLLTPFNLGAGEPNLDRELLLEWSHPIVTAIQSSTASPCLASRNLAILHIAAFNAVNATDPTYEFYAFYETPVGEIDPVSAAINAMAYGANILFPSHRALFRSLLNKQYAKLRETIPSETWIQSKEFGESVAKKLIDLRSDDGSTSSITYIPKDEIGKWKRTPPLFRPPELSHWSNTRPFAIESASQFRLPPPPCLESHEYTQALKEVREIGAADSQTRTPEQTQIAQFWSCFSYTSTPAGHWYEIATKTAREKGLSLIETARLLALANIAMADAGIACWDTKYYYESWRPIQAIQGADKDGNPSTEHDTKWDSLLEAPPHPEYVSGHGAFSGAGGKVVELFFDAASAYSFSTTSSALPGVVRKFDSFAACVAEICDSRLYGGIHFRYSNDLGRELGEQVAAFVFASQLQPLNSKNHQAPSTPSTE